MPRQPPIVSDNVDFLLDEAEGLVKSVADMGAAYPDDVETLHAIVEKLVDFPSTPENHERLRDADSDLLVMEEEYGLGSKELSEMRELFHLIMEHWKSAL